MSSELDNAILKHMRKIVNEEYRPFSFRDFLDFKIDNKAYSMRYGTIRNSQFSKDGLIELCYIDTIAFYTLAGRKFGKDKSMTTGHTDTSTTTSIPSITSPLLLILILLSITTPIKDLSLTL